MTSDNNQNSTLLHWQITKPGQRVDRPRQVKEFLKLLERVEMPVYGIHGSPGIGKTTLVLILQSLCVDRKIPNVFVNFKTHGKEYLQSPSRLISDMLDDLQTVGLEPAGVKNLHEQLETFENSQTENKQKKMLLNAYYAWDIGMRQNPKPHGLDELARLSDQFNQLVTLLTKRDKQSQPVVFFFDEAEHADPALTNWIEEYLLADLVLQPHILVMWTSRRPWRWRRPEIRRRLKQEELIPFKEEEVKEQFKLRSPYPDLASQLFRDVYGISYGHPSVNSIVIDEIDQWASESQIVTSETLHGKKNDLLSKVFGSFINDYALIDLEPDEKTACRLLSIIRIIVDSLTVREVMKTSNGEIPPDEDSDPYASLFQDLKRTKLMDYVPGKGYAINQDLRLMIRDYYQLVMPEVYKKVNMAALRVYQHWLAKPVDNRTMYVVEELYHQASLDNTKSVMVNLLKKRLDEFEKRIPDRDALIQSLNYLKDELEYDTDLERTSGYLVKKNLVPLVTNKIDKINKT